MVVRYLRARVMVGKIDVLKHSYSVAVVLPSRGK